MREDKKSELTPRLRFPEFREAAGWKETPLSSIAKPISEKATEVDSGTALTLSSEQGIIQQGDYFGKAIAGNNPERYIKIVRDDFVYNDRITKSSIYGTIKRLSKCDGGIVSPIYKCFRFNGGENPIFWDMYFESGTHETELSKLTNEGARVGRYNISIDKFLSLSGWRPSPAEQQKIADCLGTLDELIEAQSRKLDALKAHKKGLMQNLFPREGETTPRFRFPEFQDAPEWEMKALGELLLSKPDYGINAPAVPYSDLLPTYLRITDISDDGISLRNGRVSVDVEPVADIFLEDGDIVFARTGASVGKSYKYRPRDGRLVFAGFLIRVRPDLRKLNSSFFYQYLSTRRYWDWVAITSPRSGQPGINGDEYASLPVPLPSCSAGSKSMEEQNRIADALSFVDELIVFQMEKLEALKTHKKGLMQQLFPRETESEKLEIRSEK